MTTRTGFIPARLFRRSLGLSILLAGTVALSACGSPASSSPGAANPTAAPATKSAAPTSTGVASPGAAPASSPAPSASAAPAGSPAAAPALSQKANANTASQDEVQRALEAGGVPNAARWAREVTEYRPYPTNDPSFGKLRQELAKYNPAPDVVDKIVASLTL